MFINILLEKRHFRVFIKDKSKNVKRIETKIRINGKKHQENIE